MAICWIFDKSKLWIFGHFLSQKLCKNHLLDFSEPFFDHLAENENLVQNGSEMIENGFPSV